MKSRFKALFPALGDQLTYEDVRQEAHVSAHRSRDEIVRSNAAALNVTVDEYESLSFSDITDRFVEQGITESIDLGESGFVVDKAFLEEE